jgi:hypothetical protein
MRRAEVTLDDKFLLTEGRVFIIAMPPGGRSRLAGPRQAAFGASRRFSVQVKPTLMFKRYGTIGRQSDEVGKDVARFF